jgi:hypothetical protein
VTLLSSRLAAAHVLRLPVYSSCCVRRQGPDAVRRACPRIAAGLSMWSVCTPFLAQNFVAIRWHVRWWPLDTCCAAGQMENFWVKSCLYTLVENGLCHTRGLKLWCTSGVSLGQSLHEQGRTKILAVVRLSCFCGDLHFSHVHDIAARIWSSHGIPQAETSVIAPPARTLCASQ